METAKKYDHYSARIANKTGEGARVLKALGDAGVNFIAVWGYVKSSRIGILEFIPEDGKVFAKAAKAAGLELGPKVAAFVVNGQDRPGAVAEALGSLGAAGINVVAAQAVCGGEGRYGAALYVAPADARKAAKVLGAQ